MNRQEKDYLAQKLRRLAEESKKEFADAHPQGWTAKEILMELQYLGFTTPDPNSTYYGYSRTDGYSGVTRPLTDEMVANKVLVEDFYKKVDSAMHDATDAIYLGSADAVTALTSFKETLAELAR